MDKYGKDRAPWENEDGSTNVEGYLDAYEIDDNVFWWASSGHTQNVLDELIWMRKDLEK
jgi:hypothetical protein